MVAGCSKICIHASRTLFATLRSQYIFQYFMNKRSQFLSLKWSFQFTGRGYIMSCNLSELQDQVWILQSWLSMLLWEHLKTLKTDLCVTISDHKAFIKESIQGVCEQIIASNSHASKAHVGHSQNFQFCLWSSVHSFQSGSLKYELPFVYLFKTDLSAPFFSCVNGNF